MSKPKILVVADKLDWAYHDIARFIYDNLSNDYDIYIDFVRSHCNIKTTNVISFFRQFKERRKHIKNRFISNDNNYDIILYLGFYFDKYFVESNLKFKNKFWKSKYVVKGIYTDGIPPQGSDKGARDLKTFYNIHAQDADALVCGSKLIKDKFKDIPNKVFYANISFDENIWPSHKIKKNIDKRFVVSWTGNPDRQFKGFYTHILPSIEIAKEKYPEIELKTRFSGPLKTLHEHYLDVDASLIASNADAGPFSAVESCLCNVPMISTNIGMPHEIINNGINGFIVDRDVNQMAQKIIELYENRDLLYKMSLRVRNDYLRGIGNKDFRMKQWKNLFDSVLKKHNKI